MIKSKTKFVTVCNMGIKKTECDAYFESVEKAAKNLCEKGYKQTRDGKLEFSTFINMCESYRPVTFWVNIFAFFSTYS